MARSESRKTIKLRVSVVKGSACNPTGAAIVIQEEVKIMLSCTPFLLFDGDCAEAMRFYQKCLGGELTLSKLGDTPMKDQFPQEKHDRIINARLKNGAVEISASDWMASPALAPKQGNTTAIYVAGGSREELKAVFDRLAQGADKQWFQDLHDMPFGVYGQFFDKYGVQWIFRGETKK
jgi:PhnB protein